MKESIQTNVENVQSSQVKKFFHPNYEAYCIFSICLRPQYLLSIDHSLPLSHQFCPLIIREHALNFYTLQAITMPDCVLLFDHQSHDTSTFLDSLLPLHPPQAQGNPLFSFIQLLGQRMATIVAHIVKMLNLLPSRLTIEFHKRNLGSISKALWSSIPTLML
ncbi:hypothetical protein HPP92_013760 [Vanilla planifolia]|uniref:Uncharacterized protein n=1 Tax=Vanilla planifolia TaxID=51239 RepID=A0A835QXK9_VANPL|nr:hypothetical protein HPP92_013760 [Vanilla planifolia]